MGNLKRIVEGSLAEAKNQLLFFEQQEEFYKIELSENANRIQQVKSNIAEFEEFLADGKK